MERLKSNITKIKQEAFTSLNKSEPIQRMKHMQREYFASHHEVVLANTPRRRMEGHWEQFQELMATGNYHPAIFGYHSSHAAGIPAMEEAYDMIQEANAVLPPDNKFTGSLILYAHNIRDGQPEELVNYFNLIEPTLSRLHVQPQLVIREKDKHAVSPEALEQNRLELHQSLSQLVENGQIPIVLPEGTVEAGRKKPGGKRGEINGMVQLQKNSIELITSHIRRRGKEPLLIFLATTGSHKIYDPETKKVRGKAKMHVVFGSEFPTIAEHLPPMMDTVVNWPLPYSDIERDFSENGRLPKGTLEQLGGEIIASMLPVEEQGIYREKHLLSNLTAKRTQRHLAK